MSRVHPAPSAPPPLPLHTHLGHLDRVLVRERVRRLLVAMQRRRDEAEDRHGLAELLG